MDDLKYKKGKRVVFTIDRNLNYNVKVAAKCAAKELVQMIKGEVVKIERDAKQFALVWIGVHSVMLNQAFELPTYWHKLHLENVNLFLWF